MKIFPILVVDDDPHIADILSHAAKTSFPEAQFLPVNNFEAAKHYIDNLTGRGPKLILLDVDLQEQVDGFDFLRLLQNHAQARLLPVVMQSSNGSATLKRKAYNFGANSFTIKPFGLDGWKRYLAQLRSYWMDTVQLPGVWFESESELN